MVVKQISFLHKISLVIFGVLLAVIIGEAGLRISGFAILFLQECRNKDSLSKHGEYRILCLGESTTQGQYPVYLEEILNQATTGIKFSVIDEGISAVKTEDIVAKIEYNLDKYKPDLVVTMMGINDIGPHLPRESILLRKPKHFYSH